MVSKLGAARRNGAGAPIHRRQWWKALPIVAALVVAAAALAVASPGAKAATGGSPAGAVDLVNGAPAYYAFPEGPPQITGYAVDLDFWNWWLPVTVRVDVTWHRMRRGFDLLVGSASATGAANGYRGDLNGTLIGPYHGFALPVPGLAPSIDGRFLFADRKVACVTALDLGPTGTDTLLGCYDLPLRARIPSTTRHRIAW